MCKAIGFIIDVAGVAAIILSLALYALGVISMDQALWAIVIPSIGGMVIGTIMLIFC